MQKRRMPFPMSEECGLVEQEIYRLTGKNVSELRKQYLSTSNIYRMKHGRSWKSMHSSEPEEETHAKLHSTEISIDVRRIVNNDATALVEFMRNITREMHDAFLLTMFETLDASTKRSGNVVSAKPFKEAFEEMLMKIAFGVDKYGVPSRPQIGPVGPKMMAQIEESSRIPDPAFDARIETIIGQKEAEAIAEEARRISRYKIGQSSR